MADIAMCLNIKCTKRSGCYRYRAVASPMQAYGAFEQDSKGNCEYHWSTVGWGGNNLIPMVDADNRAKRKT